MPYLSASAVVVIQYEESLYQVHAPLPFFLLSFFLYFVPPLIGGGIKRLCCLTSVCLSVAYIGPKSKSRTERPRKTKIGTEVAHVTRDSDTTFKVKRLKVKVTRLLYSPPS